MKLYSIASGSSGNCIFVGDEQTGILIDVGISMKKVKEGLEAENLSLDRIQAIFVTHEHTDHISGLGRCFAGRQSLFMPQRVPSMPYGKREI